VFRLKNEVGSWIDDVTPIKQQFINDFTLRFQSARNSLCPLKNLNSPSVVTIEDNQELIKPVTDKEIYEAISQMDPSKAPGPDGGGATFYQRNWNVIRDHLCLVVKDFLSSGKMLKEINHTLIALIPKVHNPEQTNHFRPISLCNTLHEIIAKILVNRMRIILERII